LQICAAFTNAAIFRMKKTWDKVPKNVSENCTMRRAAKLHVVLLD